MDSKLWEESGFGQNADVQEPRQSSFGSIFDNIAAWGKAAYADTMAIPMGRKIKDVYDKLNNGQYQTQGEYDSLVQELNKLRDEENQYRQTFEENQKVLNQNNSMFRDFTEIGGTAQGIKTQALDTLMGAGIGAAGGTVLPGVGTAAGAGTGARIGNVVGSVHQAVQDADTNAIEAWEKVLNEGGTPEQAEQAYNDAFWNNMPTEALDIVSSMYMGGKLAGVGGKLLNKALGSKMAGKLAQSTVANTASKVSRFDLPARAGTYVAKKTGKPLAGQAVGIGLTMAENALEEGIQEPWQDYATERAVDIQRRQYDPNHEGIRDFSVTGEGGLLDYYTTPEGRETALKAAKMGAVFGGVGGLMSKSQFTELGTANADSIEFGRNFATEMADGGILSEALKTEEGKNRYNNIKTAMGDIYGLTEQETEALTEEDVGRMWHDYFADKYNAGNREYSGTGSAQDLFTAISGEETNRWDYASTAGRQYLDKYGKDPGGMFQDVNKGQVLSEEQVQEVLESQDEELTDQTENTGEDVALKVKGKKGFIDPKTSEEAKNEQAEQKQQKKQKGFANKIGKNWERIDEGEDYDYSAESNYRNTVTGRVANIKKVNGGYIVTDVTNGEQNTPHLYKKKGEASNFLKSKQNQKTAFQSNQTQEVTQTLPKEDGVISTKDGKDAEGNEWYNGRLIQSKDAVEVHSLRDLHDYYKDHQDLMSKDLYAEVFRGMMRFGVGETNNSSIVLDLANRKAGGFGSKTTEMVNPNDPNSAIANAVIRLYAGADLATAAHEIAHLGWINLSGQDRATFSKWAMATEEDFVARVLGMPNDENFRNTLREALTNRESQVSQELWARIQSEGATLQTIDILNGHINEQNVQDAIDERFAWEFSNWYAQGYIKGTEPRNIIERILYKACQSLQGALRLLYDTNRYLNDKGENGEVTGRQVGDIFSRMSATRKDIGSVVQQPVNTTPIEQTDLSQQVVENPAQGFNETFGEDLNSNPYQDLSRNTGTIGAQTQKAERPQVSQEQSIDKNSGTVANILKRKEGKPQTTKIETVKPEQEYQPNFTMEEGTPARYTGEPNFITYNTRKTKEVAPYNGSLGQPKREPYTGSRDVSKQGRVATNEYMADKLAQKIFERYKDNPRMVGAALDNVFRHARNEQEQTFAQSVAKKVLDRLNGYYGGQTQYENGVFYAGNEEKQKQEKQEPIPAEGQKQKRTYKKKPKEKQQDKSDEKVDLTSDKESANFLIEGTSQAQKTKTVSEKEIPKTQDSKPENITKTQKVETQSQEKTDKTQAETKEKEDKPKTEKEKGLSEGQKKIIEKAVKNGNYTTYIPGDGYYLVYGDGSLKPITNKQYEYLEKLQEEQEIKEQKQKKEQKKNNKSKEDRWSKYRDKDGSISADSEGVYINKEDDIETPIFDINDDPDSIYDGEEYIQTLDSYDPSNKLLANLKAKIKKYQENRNAAGDIDYWDSAYEAISEIQEDRKENDGIISADENGCPWTSRMVFDNMVEHAKYLQEQNEETEETVEEETNELVDKWVNQINKSKNPKNPQNYLKNALRKGEISQKDYDTIIKRTSGSDTKMQQKGKQDNDSKTITREAENERVLEQTVQEQGRSRRVNERDTGLDGQRNVSRSNGEGNVVRSEVRENNSRQNNTSIKFQEAGRNAENQVLLTPEIETKLEDLFWKLIRKKEFHGMDKRWSSGMLDYYKSIQNKASKTHLNPEYIQENKAYLTAIKNINEYIHKKYPQYKNVYRGVDGHWRFEFSDKDGKLINGFEKLEGMEKETTLDKILKHDNLYKFYPILKDMPVHLVRNEGIKEFLEVEDDDYHAAYDPETKSIYVNSDMFGKQEVRESLLHEIQHAIQDIEGFANGEIDTDLNNDYEFSEGEKQASLTERRSNMSDEELQQNPRYKTLNPEEKTIIDGQRPNKKAKKVDIKMQSSGNNTQNNDLGYIDKQKDIYSVTFTKSAQQNAENKKKIAFYRNNNSYWKEDTDKSTGSIIFTRALPYKQHQKTIIYDDINGKTVGKRKKGKVREYYEAVKEQLIKWLFNDKYFLQKAARNVGAIESYMRMMVMKDQGAVAGSAIEDGIVKHNSKNGERTKSLNSIIEAVGEEKQTEFLKYCEAFRILDLDKRGIKQKMSAKDANDITNKVRQSQEGKLFEEQRKNFVEYNHELLWTLVDGGFITEDQYDKFLQIDPNFIPLSKNMDELEGYVDGFRDSKTMINIPLPIHKIGTSLLEVKNPFLEMQRRTVEYYVKASRNKAGLIFVNDIADAIAQDANGNVVATNQGLIRKLASVDRNGKPISHDNKQYVFYVWNKGKKEYYQVADREIYIALRSFDAEQMSALSKIMNATAGRLSRLVRSTATMTPDFGLRNLVRDNMEAVVSSEHGFLPLVDSIWGMYQMANDTQWFREYQSMNGEMGTRNREGEQTATVEHDIKDNVKLYKTYLPLIKKDYRQFTDSKRSKAARAKSLLMLVTDVTGLHSLYKANKRMNDYLEMGTRIGEYRNARMGYRGLTGRLGSSGNTIFTNDRDLAQAKSSKMFAAYKSKDVTLNFGQHGILGKELNRYIPFFNASLQGIYKTANTIDNMFHAKDTRLKQELWFKFSLMAAMGMAAALSGSGDPDYDEAPEYEHDNFWIFSDGVRIPKDQLFGRLVGGAVEKATRQYIKDGDVDKIQLLKDTLGNFMIDKCIPAVVDLAMGTYGNYDTFHGQAVTPDYMVDRLGYLQKDLSTSKIGADLSEAIYDVTKGLFGTPVDIGAKKIDFVISKTLSNMGNYVKNLYDLGTNPNERMTRGAEPEDKGGFAERSKELPYPMNTIVGTFATNRNTFQSISDFYERHKELLKLSSAPDKMSKVEAKAWEAYKAAYKQDKKYRDALKAIKQDKSLTGAQKREKADKIFKQQIKMSNKLKDWERKHGLT